MSTRATKAARPAKAAAAKPAAAVETAETTEPESVTGPVASALGEEMEPEVEVVTPPPPPMEFTPSAKYAPDKPAEAKTYKRQPRYPMRQPFDPFANQPKSKSKK